MKLLIEQSLASRYPAYRMYTVIAREIDNTGEDETLKATLAAVQAEVRARFNLEDEALRAGLAAFQAEVRARLGLKDYEQNAFHEEVRARFGDLFSLEVNPRVLAWRAAFRDFGADPSITRPSLEALLHRVLTGHKIPFRNKVVAISNMISLKYLLPSGGDDLAQISGDFGLRYADGLEPFTAIGGSKEENPESNEDSKEENSEPSEVVKEEHPEPNEVIYADEEKVLCRCWVWKQGQQSRITDRSRFVAVNVDVLPPTTAEEGRAAAEELAELIKKYCGGTTEIVSIGGDQLSATIDPRITEQLVREKFKDNTIQRLLNDPHNKLSDSDDMSRWSLHDLLLRGNIEQVVVKDDFIARLDRGNKLTIYQGFDPTSPDLHVGHLVSLRVLRWFQLHGHRVIFLLGDATALIGDPSGRSAQRKMLTHDQVKENMLTYKEQASLVLDFDGGPNPVELMKNSDWLLPFRLENIIELMSHVTMQQLLQRNMFKVRMKKKDNPLYYNETIYPLFQGYDSVAMRVDAELGGRDQLFNMLTGRDLEREYLNKEKFVLTTPLLAGFDGRKMSKTYGNTVNLTARPFEIFDGIMHVKDELILQYARLLTNIPWPELALLEALLPDDPLAVKERVAFELVQTLHGKEHASAAREEFVRVRRAKAVPQEIIEVRIPGSGGEAALLDVLVKATPEIVKSKSELRRLIRQGSVTLNGERVGDEQMRCDVGALNGQVLQIGKARFFRLAVE